MRRTVSAACHHHPGPKPMPNPNRCVRLICTLALACVAVAGAASAATLGRGLDHLVSLEETGNAKLASALRLHIVAADGSVMVHVRLDDSAPAAQALGRLVAAGLRITAVSEMDPTLIEGYLVLASVRS